VLFLTVLWNVVLPIFLVAGLGVLLQRKMGLDAQSLSRTVFYVFSPCLTFSGLYSLHMARDGISSALILAFSIVTIMLLAGGILSRWRHYSRLHTSATLLVLLNSNTGNYGLPLNQFAFGEAGLKIAILYFVINSTLANSVGVYIASAGRASPMQALRNVSRTPLVYATVLALIFNWRGWSVPAPLFKAISLSAQAAVPVMLIILGIHLGRLGTHVRWRHTLPVVLLKLTVAPTLAWLISGFLGMTGVNRAVGIVQLSMPTAVMSTVLSTQFDCEPEYVAEVVFVTTVVSILTLTVLVSLLKTFVVP